MRWLLALVLVGCGGGAASDVSDGTDGQDGLQGPQGEQGEQGEQGVQGEPGPAGAVAYRWVDANGVEVSPTQELGFFDDAGNWWEVDDETAEVTFDSRSVYYENDDCTGEAWVFAVKPRRPFKLQHSDEMRVRSDVVVEEIANAYSSTIGSGECNPRTSPHVDMGVRLADTSVAALPEPGWVGPVHIEPG